MPLQPGDTHGGPSGSLTWTLHSREEVRRDLQAVPRNGRLPGARFPNCELAATAPLIAARARATSSRCPTCSSPPCPSSHDRLQLATSGSMRVIYVSTRHLHGWLPTARASPIACLLFPRFAPMQQPPKVGESMSADSRTTRAEGSRGTLAWLSFILVSVGEPQYRPHLLAGYAQSHQTHPHDHSAVRSTEPAGTPPPAGGAWSNRSQQGGGSRPCRCGGRPHPAWRVEASSRVREVNWRGAAKERCGPEPAARCGAHGRDPQEPAACWRARSTRSVAATPSRTSRAPPPTRSPPDPRQQPNRTLRLSRSRRHRARHRNPVAYRGACGPAVGTRRPGTGRACDEAAAPSVVCTLGNPSVRH